MSKASEWAKSRPESLDVEGIQAEVHPDGSITIDGERIQQPSGATIRVSNYESAVSLGEWLIEVCGDSS